jgi:DNA-binding NarL/FixJ family response regulator
MNLSDVPMKIRLLLVDDHAVMLAGLRSILNCDPLLEVVGTASNAESAMAQYPQLLPDVNLLDIHMPGVDGITCLRRLLAQFPGARGLMLTSSEAEEDMVQALEAGALGYIIKTACSQDLIMAILGASQGRRILGPGVQNRFEERDAGGLLSSRELGVLHYVRKGFSNGEIGDLMHISSHTVKAHVASVLRKLDSADRAEAVARAFERGLLKP